MGNPHSAHRPFKAVCHINASCSDNFPPVRSWDCVSQELELPDTNFDGFNFWLAKLNQFNGNFIAAEMVKAFISSGEYRQRFGAN